MDLTTEQIKNALNGDEAFLSELLPYAKKEGRRLKAGDLYGNKGDSFVFDLDKGCWKDFATGESGSSIVDLLMAQKNLSVKEAFDECRLRLGDSPIIVEKKSAPQKKDFDLVACPTDRFPTFVYKDGQSHRISKMWRYVGEDGRTYAFDCRVDYPDGSKDVVPFRWNDLENRYTQKMLPVPRMLCGIDDLADSKKVIIVEGCKTREATKYYFRNWCVLTWQGGCEAVDKADWDVVKDKDVFIIPDADRKLNKDGSVISWDKQCGQKAALFIAEKLSKNGCHVQIVNTQSMSELKDGWDVADAFESNMSQSELVAYIKENKYEYISKKEKKEDINVVIETKEENEEMDYDDSYFRCLGESGSSTFFFKYASGQVIEFTPSKYDNKHLVSLAPLSYWEAHYLGEKGIDWLGACDHLSRVQEKIGYFKAVNIRGRGCWFDEGHIVLHLGRSLIIDGKPRILRDFKTKNIYEQREPINVNIDHPMPSYYSKKLIDVCNMARWEENYFGEILAGWLFSSMVCGAMRFRSHLYLIGQSGSGKSWLQDHIIKPVLGKMCVKVSSKTSEAGIRATLNNDILPVICDENEVEDSKRDAEAMQAIFDLARNASSEYSEPIVKSSPSGQVKIYYCRSAFLFSSIKTSMEKVADLNRTAFIRLKGKPQDCSEIEKIADNSKFVKLREAVEKLIDDEYCESLLARAVRLANVMRESQKIVSDVSSKIYGDRRQGDQMGMIIAGVHGLKCDSVITEDEAKDYLEVFTKNKERIYSAEDEKQEQGCLDTLMNMPIKMQTRQYPLSRCIAFVLGRDETLFEENKDEVIKTLKYAGILIDDKRLYLSTKPSSEHCVYFKTKTMYGEKGWIDELMRVSRKCKFEIVKFTSVQSARALIMPLEEILPKTSEEMPI